VEGKLLKLKQKEETLLKKKGKIEEDLKKVSMQIKELEHLLKVRDIEESIVILSGHGINLKDVIREIKKGEFDHLKRDSSAVPDQEEGISKQTEQGERNQKAMG